MPKCIHCNEFYADQLRRCPHCGRSPEESEGLSQLGTQAAPVSAVTIHARRRRRARSIMIGCLAALLVTIGVIAFPRGGEVSKDEQTASRPNPLPLVPNGPIAPPSELTPAKVDEEFGIESVRMVRHGVFVKGTCSPHAVVRVLVDGHPAALSPLGDRFTALVPLRRGTVDVVAEDVTGSIARLSADVIMAKSSTAPHRT